MAIEFIQISPSNRATCKFCGEKIGKGTPRGVASFYNRSYGHLTYYFCYKCSLENIKIEIQNQRELKNKLNKLIKKQSKAIILSKL